jgi:hypothetical protein
MQVTYKPEDHPDRAQVWEFDPTRVRQSRAEMIEKRYGARFADWVKEIQAGESRARRVLLWHLMNTDHPQVKLEDVPDFYMGEVEVDYAISDLQKLRVQVAESAMDDATKETTLERLDLEIATRMGQNVEELTPEDLGKDHRSESAESAS